MNLETGQRWEFVTSTVNSDGAISEYELQRFDLKGHFGTAQLRNLANNKEASISADWLLKGERCAPYAYWRLAKGTA